MHEKSIKVTTHLIIGNYKDKGKKRKKIERKLKLGPYFPCVSILSSSFFHVFDWLAGVKLQH